MAAARDPLKRERAARHDPDAAPISATEARALFADLKDAPALVLAVSGGPDSMALMALAARWRRALRRGPRLIAVTVDHGLRREAAAEARAVKALAATLSVEHHTLRWRGPKPRAGIPAAARTARYRLLADLARAHGTVHLLTAHTRDDQAETVLMRLSRGSGLAGLAAMARTSARDGLMLVRPLLDMPKARLVATLKRARIAYATDPSNQDRTFTRPRLRALMPVLAEEGCDARNLARLAGRLARANAAIEAVADAAERALVRIDRAGRHSAIDAVGFFAAPEEIRLRLLARAIDRAGDEGPAELSKTETLLRAMDAAWAGQGRLKQTLAGAVVEMAGNLSIAPAPPRKSSRVRPSPNKL
ncbi:tRNA lysidine(34) synthetase TilS [Bradyrhizobium sp. 2TAF24]|uniref:tRNA lysidine(34) synthetase TilS n=1 Tax=Bradyrhizobium sp. 2TAF24 TaxID=3233011 RepID=UPI003F909A7A